MAYVIDQTKPHLGGNEPGGDSRTYCPRLWDWMVDHYRLKSVYDVGCGEGHALTWFLDRGLQAAGLDGLPQCREPRADFFCHDLTTGPCPLDCVDLVWSCEVAEHIAPAFVGNYLDTICCGRVLAMTHALPGDVGWHHVNCQFPAYWIERIQGRGYTLDVEATWGHRYKGAEFWRVSGLIFTRHPS
jgi:SAM-dependent methyltransferase